MSKELMTTAKELAFRAYADGMQICYPVKIDENDIRERFELWWSMNYGNSDTTKFYHKHNVYVDGSKYIKAE